MCDESQLSNMGDEFQLSNTGDEEKPGRSKNLAFEVAAIDGGGDSLIKRHPPKKFQKLEEQHGDTNNITQELLEEKQADAEKRRKEILSKRVKSAKTASAKSVQARARVAESKEVDQDGDEPIESAKVSNSEGGI